jgi:sialate O-acetylesterase
MIPCLFGLLAAARILTLRAARFAGLAHLLEERGEGRVGLAGDVFGDLDRLALGRGGGFAGGTHGGVAVGLGHGFADATLLFGREARDHAPAIGAGLTDVAAGTITFGLTRAAFATGLIGLTFGPARLTLGLAVGLVRLTALHGFLDLLKDRGDFGVGLAGGVIGNVSGLLLGFLGSLLSLGGLLMGFLHRRVLLGLLHGLMEALLFIGAKRDRLAAFLSRTLVSGGRTRAFFGGEAEGGGEEEQGEVLHSIDITAGRGRSFVYLKRSFGLGNLPALACPVSMLPRLAFLVLCCSALVTAGELKLNRLFSDYAVLQAGESAVYGKARPGAKVSVTLGEAKAEAVAGADGVFRTTLTGLKPTEQGADLVIDAGDEKFVAKDVIVGEVWVGSGQSNMDWTVNATHALKDAVSRPADAGIRMFTVGRIPSAEPVEDIKGGAWVLADPKTVPGFSASAFYFGRELRANLKQPVGLIVSSIGGTRAEAWGPKGMYADVADAKDFDVKEAAGIKARAENLKKLQARIAVEKDAKVLAKLKQYAGKLGPVWSNGPHMNWNGMVHPWIGHSFRGVIWYQGESNASQPEAYKWVLGSMIKSWHKAWGKEFPFIIVQLPRYMARKPELAVEVDASWSRLRESMEWIADNVPGAMQSVNIDLGEEKDIHPKDKLPVGERLAYVALQRVYKARPVGEAPRVVKAERQGDAFVLTYDRPVVLKNDGKGFGLLGADDKWVFAQAKADGATVTVTGVKAPKEVRYAWANFPEVSVFSAGADGLPAGPYRSSK